MKRIPRFWLEVLSIKRLQLKAWFLTKWTGRKHDFLRPLEVPNPLATWPRNAHCFCGSERKFKKCCRSTVPAYCLRTVAIEAEFLMKAAKQLGEM